MIALDNKTFVVGLGAQKAGTTWLAQYLRAHPQVMIPAYKELHFFNIGSGDGREETQNIRFINKFKELIGDHKLDPKRPESSRYYDRLETLVDRLRLIGEPDRYLDIFRKRVRDHHVAFGEITPSYSLLTTENLKRIRETHPKVRAIFLMRDPVGRIWSNMWFKHSKNAGYDPLQRWPSALEDPGISERTRYDKILPRLENVFRPEELYLGFFETLFNDKSVRQICSFLEIDYVPADFNANPNPTRAGKVAKPPEYVAAVHERFAAVYEAMEQRYGADLPWKRSS